MLLGSAFHVDIAFALCGMEDQEIRIGETEETGETGETVRQPADDSALVHLIAEHPTLALHASSQTIQTKVFGFVYDKRVWKPRLLVLTDAMLLVLKRPDDHYLKNRIVFKESGLAIAVPQKKPVFLDLLDNAQDEPWVAQFLDKSQLGVLLTVRFNSFSDMMTVIGVSRHLSGYPDFKPSIPADCSDPQFFRDVVSLLYLYAPQRLGEAASIYAQYGADPAGYASWVGSEFGLNASVCHNLHIPNAVEEVEDVITPQNEIMASEIYLRPQYIECREIPREVSEVVYQFQQRMKEDVYGRLVQVCQFSYPSPQPLVRAIVDLYSEEWARVFDRNPFAFLKAIRESKMYRPESYTNRSYKKPRNPVERVDKMETIRE